MRFNREKEEQFLVKPTIIEVARHTADYAKKMYSERHYSKLGIDLRILWQATEAFRAGAFVAPNGDHEIRLSYGTAIEIYRDAFVLPETCVRVLVEPVFDPILGRAAERNRKVS